MARPWESYNSYYQQTLNALGVAASLMPPIVVAMGLLVKFEILDTRFYAGDLVYALISMGFILTAFVNYYLVFVRKNPHFLAYLFLAITFHALAMAFLLFVSGLLGPFLIGWVILLVAVDIYFGTIGALASMTALLATALASFVLYPFLTLNDQLVTGAALILVVATAVVLSRIRDINDHERIALEKTRDQSTFQRERLLALVNSMGDAVITTDENGIIRVYNAATLSLLDTNANLTGKNIDDVLRLKDKSGKRVNIVEEAQRRHMVASRDDLQHKFADGEIMRIYLNVAPVQPGYRAEGERGFIFILRDITKEKSLEEERDEFISVVSHELRTPIAIAEGSISNIALLQERNADPKIVTGSVKTAHEQILYLAKLVNDLGTLARAERGVGQQVEILDTHAILQEIYQTYEPQAQAKKLHFNLDIAPRLPNIKTSRLYLQEILQNFITNAIKYTKEGSITLKARVSKGDMVISIADTGIGISKSDQKHIFEKFYRSEDYRTRETSGTGLGLYLCKKLAEKLGIEITFESRLNHGSTFSFLVPKKILTDEPTGRTGQ